MEILVVGHLSRDLLITPEIVRETLGGGTAYAMLAPAIGALGSGIVTRVGRDFDQRYLSILRDSGLDIGGLRTSGLHTTRFVNQYDSAGNRYQHIEALAPSLRGQDFFPHHLNATIVHFCPLTADEIHLSCFQAVRGNASLIALDVQGYLRESKIGPVELREWNDAEAVLRYVDILKADDVEILIAMGCNSEKEAVQTVLELGPSVVIVTRDQRGSSIYTNSQHIDIPAVVPANLVDATGAGDTYTIGFLLEYFRSGDIRRAGIFAATCASFNLEHIGPYVMPSRDEVESRMRIYL